jgi:fucose 4-O-acetylase-like acetyltransferase
MDSVIQHKNLHRSQNLDIIKGIGIILVVLGHCGCPAEHFIYLFHMPIFFMASGYVLNTVYSDNLSNVWTLIRKRLKSLWLPCFLFNTIFLLLSGVFIKYNIYPEDVKTAPSLISGIFFNALMYMKGGPLAGATWFLGTLFEVTIIYTFLDYIFKRLHVKFREIVNFLFGLTLFVVSFYLIEQDIRIHSIVEHIAGAYVVFAIGVLLKKLSLNAIGFGYWIAIFSVTLAILLVCNQYGSVDLSESVYTAPWFYLLCAISGWFLIYSVSVSVSKFSRLANITCRVGQHTVCIIGLHFLAFKIVTYLQICIYDLPIEKLSNFPYLIAEPFWWVVYTVIGLGVPLLGRFLLTSVQKNCIFVQ